MAFARDKPFDDDESLSASAVGSLADWLDEAADPDMLIARKFKVGDLIDVLRSIECGIWSDGIDAMGEDA